MNGRLVSTSMVLLWCACLASVVGCDRLHLDQEDARINYSVGYKVGSDFRHQGVEIDPDTVVRGVADAMTGAEPAVTPLQMRKELADLQQRVQEAQQAKSEESGETGDDQE